MNGPCEAEIPPSDPEMGLNKHGTKVSCIGDGRTLSSFQLHQPTAAPCEA